VEEEEEAEEAEERGDRGETKILPEGEGGGENKCCRSAPKEMEYMNFPRST